MATILASGMPLLQGPCCTLHSPGYSATLFPSSHDNPVAHGAGHYACGHNFATPLAPGCCSHGPVRRAPLESNAPKPHG